VEQFYCHFEVSFDPSESVAIEQIYNWFNSVLKKRGESGWSKQGRKWSHVVGRLNVHAALWKHRNQPLIATPVTSAPSFSLSNVQRKLF